MNTPSNENILHAIEQMHIRGMKRALKLRDNYENLSKEEIYENEFYINNNINQYTKHLDFAYNYNNRLKK